MASKTAEQVEAPEAAPEVSQDGPLLDMSDAAVKKMIKAAKTRGFVTYDELNKVLPSEEFSSEQIEDTLSMLSEMGINVVENDEADENQEGAAERDSDDDDDEAEPTGKAVATTTTTSSALDRTDDPVRMYLREMGSVELLSREGEIAIAKRIEAGRETMIAGLCESPLTFQAIIIWRDELNEGKILLRDIIDLDATFEAKAVPMRRRSTIPRPRWRARRRTVRASSRKRKKSTRMATTTTRCRLPRWKPSSSRKCSKPSTRSRATTRNSASCRTRRSSSR